MTVLRPELFAHLERWCGRGRVRIVWPGREISWSMETVNGKLRRKIDPSRGEHWGEIYRICCPYCRDTKFRLYISYMWGHFDEQTQSRNLWLAHCQNENCVRGENCFRLYEEICSSICSDNRDVVLKGVKVDPRLVTAIEWPGAIWTLNKVPPTHEVYQYIVDRKFDPVWLGKYMNVGYVVEGKGRNQNITGRLFIPVYKEEQLVGWQARLLDDKEITASNPKYRTAPGMPRGQILYNYDNAKNCNYVVVTEGPTDVWRYGPEAVAVFGKPTGFHAQTLVNGWKKIVMMLDPDAKKESAALVSTMRTRGVCVAEIDLPDDNDPADFSTADLRKIVYDQSLAQGIDLHELAR